MEYEGVIGLEVHVQIKTESKMFTRAPAGYGAPPNTLTDPVVMGLPGVLPVMNKKAIDKIIKAGLLLKCEIAEVCKWDRKNYFYPDSPKNYQISQYDQPICEGGEVEIELPGPSRNVMGEHRMVALTRIHLEEDVGKLNHFDGDSLVDLNRAGTPLMEIVSEPVMHSGDEAFAYLTALKQAMIYAGISDCDMEKGQLRCDANISVRPQGSEILGTKVELKNLNSITGVKNGIDYEIKRQIKAIQTNEPIVQETRRWNAEGGFTSAMRSKEMAHDYRYFPDPDLMPVRVDKEWIETLKAELPELPFEKQRRYQEEMGLPYTITSVLVPDRNLCDYFEEAITDDLKPQAVANWIANDLLRELSNAGRDITDCPIKPTSIAELIRLVDKGVISSKIAKDVFLEMFASGDSPDRIVEKKGLKQSSDTGELTDICNDVISANPKSVEDFQNGKENAINFLKGQVMKATRGKANPKVVDDLLRQILTS
ncbi:MAG: Asp-tRNA(Asn)/Glu-tRNA(Gln) amidotransferase subunit GatB [Opitutales bacterium]|nr:Asp-tRNA(Asn)/Glu-tRNA(Gln) amidotransferase subunit GatB [Opitutales bacterium]MCH8540793.1 Asp-tRNA(Asn)/Glu-tRNA(Gln) amidotransferase subunit GatB [Opitutales bacterium]